jgi:hypothetical protein
MQRNHIARQHRYQKRLRLLLKLAHPPIVAAAAHALDASAMRVSCATSDRFLIAVKMRDERTRSMLDCRAWDVSSEPIRPHMLSGNAEIAAEYAATGRFTGQGRAGSPRSPAMVRRPPAEAAMARAPAPA